jgi:hypothetical protein
MIAGYTEHAADFPDADPIALQAILDAYKAKRDAHASASAQTKTATLDKNVSLAELLEYMTNSLKRSEADVKGDSVKLAEIGWGPRQTPQPVPVPAAPTSLHVVAEGQGTIFLQWKRPEPASTVRNYVIERCQQLTAGGDYGPWTIAGSTYNCEINLAGQPTDVKLMYAVKAVNSSGESDASNTVVVSLP